MRIGNFMAFIGFLTVLQVFPLYAMDALVDDFSSGTKENFFEYFWYYYDDNAGTKRDDRPIAGKGTKQSTIDVAYSMINREASGSKDDTFKLRNYSFLVKEEAGNKYACMPFTYGDKWHASWCSKASCAAPFVGIGTKLAPDKKYLNLTGATAVTFRCRSHVNDLTVYFRVETMDIARDSSFAFWAKPVEVPKGVWTECTVALPADLNQPGWATSSQVKESFDIAECTNLCWEVPGEYNTTVIKDTLDVDDVRIADYQHIAPSVWYKAAANRPVRGLVASFETLPKSATPVGTSWFAYDDHEDFGTSSITRGAAVDHKKGLFPLDWSGANTGFNNTGSGAAVQMQFGKPLKQVDRNGDTTVVQGFTGIGFSLYDSAKGLYFNSATGKLGAAGGAGRTDSLYFESLADGDFRYLTLEVRDSNDVPDINAPARKDKRGRGLAWYRNFPKTGPNVWRSVCIPIDSLVAHGAWKGYEHIPLDKTNLATMQFRAQGPEGAKGAIQIDNVYFPGIDFNPPDQAKNGMASPGRQSCFRTFYRNGFIRVQGEWNRDCGSGTIKIIDSKGGVTKIDRIASAPAFSLDISTKQIPAGVYLLLVSGAGADGKIVSRTPVTILK
jgi:hypothetical protein